ncbi:MAG: efflux RND transporter permease subunit [Candidatus Aminicenantes bacterium]|nr:efflux RND transporter permease subunit [Candidatus Aminicenantes bacterium]
MKKTIRLFIKYPILGNVILVAIFLFGWIGFKSLKTTFFPIIPSKTIIIQAAYPGASPEEIEEAIVLKIEDNLKGVTGLERVTSVSSENYCLITVTMLTGYDINVVLQDVKNAVNQVSSFPVGMERLTIYRKEARNFAIDFVLAGKVSLNRLKQEARRAERDLLATEGISKVTLSGFPDEEIEIALRENDLRAYGLTFQEVASAIQKANIRMTGGKIKGKEEELLIRANVKGYHAQELANHMLMATDDGVIIRLKDVADLKDRWSENPNRVYHNGHPAVRVTIQNTNREDLFQITNLVKSYIDKYNRKHSDVKAYVVRDGSEIIQERIDILSSNGLLGMFLVLLFLSLSLNTRMSLWVALAIPVSFAGMLMIGPFFNLTINVMSLLGMILVLGILVDDGIVIGENIYQHHERGEKPIPAAVKGTVEVLPSVVASILTTVVIFTTFFFLEGGLGDRTRDLAFVVVATLLISLVEATFILPAHIAHSRALSNHTRKKNIIERGADKALKKIKERVYGPALKFVIKFPLIGVAVPVALFIITLGALQGSLIKTTFFPVIERRSVDVILEMPAGTPDSITDGLLSGIEQKVWQVNDSYKKEHQDNQDLILSISRRIGPGTHQGKLSVTLISSELRDWDFMEATNRIRGQVGKVPGAEKLEFGGRGFWGKPISIALASNNLKQLREAKETLKAELRKVEKLKDVVDDDPPGLREVNIRLKERAHALGLTTADVLSQVRSGFFGGEAQRILRGIDEVKIWVRYTQKDRSTIQKLEDMRIRLPGNKEYPLGEIADFSIQRGVMTVNHIDAQRVVIVEADISNPKESVPDTIADIKKDILPDIAARYPDIQFLFEGQSRENLKTMRAIGRIVPPILILMFLIIVITFRSFSQALVVLLLIPFSIVGVLWGHFIQGYIVSILSWFGAIALAGIVVNDSLVLVSTLNRMLKQGKKFKEALFETGLSRFRPVLLTSLTTIAGLGPLIFEKSHQAQFLSPMAISVAYGLFFSTLLTLLMLPSMLAILNINRRFFSRVFLKKNLTAEDVEPAIREEFFARDQSEVICEEK